MTPEGSARERFDAMLDETGWAVQSSAELNLGARRGVALRKFSVKAGEADLLAQGRALKGVQEEGW
jgi:type I restriction enzyme R subunit